jgi:hypothetical protein
MTMCSLTVILSCGEGLRCFKKNYFYFVLIISFLFYLLVVVWQAEGQRGVDVGVAERAQVLLLGRLGLGLVLRRRRRRGQQQQQRGDQRRRQQQTHFRLRCAVSPKSGNSLKKKEINGNSLFEQTCTVSRISTLEPFHN